MFILSLALQNRLQRNRRIIPKRIRYRLNFIRTLVETPNAVPEDVWLQVLSPCRRDLIQRTVKSVVGAINASLHRIESPFVIQDFGLCQQDVLKMAVGCVRYTESITKDTRPDTTWHPMFRPEAFPTSTHRGYESVRAEPRCTNQLF